MAIWMDLTNSMVMWQGGIVGIIRVELETAKTMKRVNPDLRFSVYRDGNFIDITESVKWLWEAENASTAYIEKMGRDSQHSVSNKKDLEGFEGKKYVDSQLERAMMFSESRHERLREAGKLWVSDIPAVLRAPVWKFAKTVYHFMRHVRSILKQCKEQKKVASQQQVSVPMEQTASDTVPAFPYQDGDSIFSCGWYTSGKEKAFTCVKNHLKNFYISYLVYDLVLVKPETSCFYYEYQGFSEYLHWISANCDHVFYWGKTAQKDAEEFYRKNRWRVPYGSPIFYGSVMQVSNKCENTEEILKKLGIIDKYVMMVGSIEPKKNYDVIYRAYRIIAEKWGSREIPQCVIIGSNFNSCKGLVNCMLNDPLVKDKFLFIRATDEELNLLYQNAEFTLLPSLYEGWSIVMLEMLSYGKVCIASDIAPLREVGGELAIYVDPLDPVQWADEIIHLMKNPHDIREYENRIKAEWAPPNWSDGAKEILTKMKKTENMPKIYYDMTLGYRYSFVEKPALTGIPRTVLLLARNLYQYIPGICYFAIVEGGYIELKYQDIQNIIEGNQLDTDFLLDSPSLRTKQITIPAKYPFTFSREYTQEKRTSSQKNSIKKERSTRAKWLLASVCTGKLQDYIIRRIYSQKDPQIQDVKEVVPISDVKLMNIEIDVPFLKGDFVVTFGPGFPDWVLHCLEKEKKKKDFTLVQTIYDMTPILLPHTHTEETIRTFTHQFLPSVFKVSDHMIYGGKTAMRDAEIYAQEHGWPIPIGHPVKWGSDFKRTSYTKERLNIIMQYYGIKKPYILTVGTVQRRKNQEILYHAFLHLIQQNRCKDLQLVIAGYPGWGYDEFLEYMANDSRCKERIRQFTPSDADLSVLYQNCLFTVLPSLYEGWSLTLPESLEYGKFCIASKVDPLIEIGGDLIEYVEPYDTVGWANAIERFSTDRNELRQREKRIRREWKGTTWDGCSRSIATILNREIKYKLQSAGFEGE